MFLSLHTRLEDQSWRLVFKTSLRYILARWVQSTSIPLTSQTVMCGSWITKTSVGLIIRYVNWDTINLFRCGSSIYTKITDGQNWIRTKSLKIITTLSLIYHAWKINIIKERDWGSVPISLISRLADIGDHIFHDNNGYACIVTSGT